MGYTTVQIKERYSEDLKATYEQMLAEEEEKLQELNKEWTALKESMLYAIAKYDVATKGGKSRDLNTLNVEIITKTEKFRSCDENPKRVEQEREILGNITALKQLLNMK